VPGAAAVWRREAVLTVSPMTVPSWNPPTSRTPATTSPVLTPIRSSRRGPWSRSALQLAVDLAEGGLHRQRGVDGPAGVVVVGDRRPEQRHHGVADELVDRAASPDDLLDEPPEAGRRDVADLLRVEALGERGEADDVGEEDGDGATLLVAEDRGAGEAPVGAGGAGQLGAGGPG
jgi:hypothetical protein